MTKYLSTILLILVNLVPLYGVLFWGLDIADLLLLYLAELVLVGLMNIIKVVILTKTFKVIFVLVIPYILICFFLTIIAQTLLDAVGVPQISFPLLISLSLLFLSHVFSLITNFIRGGEYIKRETKGMMPRYLARVIMLSIPVLIVGSILNVFLPTAGILVAFIIFKIVFDVLAHIYEHDDLMEISTNVTIGLLKLIIIFGIIVTIIMSINIFANIITGDHYNFWIR